MQTKVLFRRFILFWGFLSIPSENDVLSADWPMWRKDQSRSAVSSEELPSELHLQWTRQLLTPSPAWPNEARLHFDTTYEPIIFGSRMYVGSMVDGSLTAFDCATGKELWRFYTNGPIRLAPVAYENRVCFGSDDGWLYCVDADSGKILWKVSGAPEDREQYIHLGNTRLVSFWPVRGGPVVADGVVYFGAGIWPTLGVFIHAIDAKTGYVLWTNNNSHAIENVRIDHNYMQESGISPQGHMLVHKGMLIVPNGRSMPARIDRKTGKLQYFVQGYRNGDSRVVVSGEIALVGLNGVINLNDGREIASRWLSAGKDAPEGWSSSKVDLFEGPLFPYKFMPGFDYRSVIDGNFIYGIENGTVYAYDMKLAKTKLHDQKFNGKDIKPAHWQVPALWKLDTDFSDKKLATNSLLKAGNRLYGHSGQNLFAVELNEDLNKPGTVTWKKQLSSEPTSLIAANGQLFIVTKDGAIQCFGEKSIEPKVFNLTDEINKTPSDTSSDVAKSILDTLSDDAGYAVVAGLKNGRLVEEILTHSNFHVIAIDENRQVIDQLRRKYSGSEKIQKRFQAIVEKPTDTRLPPYIANLITTEDTDKLLSDINSHLNSLYKSLRPYGGTLCLPLNKNNHELILNAASTNQLAGMKIQTTNDLVMIQRIGPLPGSSIWSHETGDAARSFYSRDDLVRAPLGVLWYGDGRDHGFNKRKDYGHGLKPQVAGGRLIALQVTTNTLKSVDAYTGRLLWSRKLGNSARYASMRDAVYVADARKCLILDPASGETRNTFEIDVNQPADVPVSATDIRVGKDIIVIAVRFNKENAISKGRWNSKFLVALDRTSGQQLWSRPAILRYNTAAIALSANQVFLADSHSPEEIGLMRRRGKDVKNLPSTILALDARTGRELWKSVRNDPPANLTTLHFMSLRTQDDWLAYSADQDLLLSGKANRTFALDAQSGKEVWQKPIRGQQPLILGPKSFINQTGHTYDVSSGNLINGAALFRRGGCNYAVGGKNLLFLRSNCATYIDINSRQEYAIRNLRSGCSNSLVAADGLLNAPCFSVGCVCNYPIQTSFAMFHMPQSASWHGTTPVKQSGKVLKGK